MAVDLQRYLQLGNPAQGERKRGLEKGTGKRKRPPHFRKAFKLFMVASLRYRFCSGGKSLVRIGYGNYSVDLNPF